MEASHRKLSAAVLLLLLLTVAAEMCPAAQAKECLFESATFNGLCFSSKKCNDKCLQEGTACSGGKCGGLLLKCWCIWPCETKLLAPASMGAMGS